ncbi:hypothetical protein RZV17_04235 [Xanthomonas cannabis]|uniref:hypothetical protein n=1 Tax=Xanthomonas cannabis TaxID=1885674 RepID=UPI0033BC4251
MADALPATAAEPHMMGAAITCRSGPARDGALPGKPHRAQARSYAIHRHVRQHTMVGVETVVPVAII